MRECVNARIRVDAIAMLSARLHVRAFERLRLHLTACVSMRIDARMDVAMPHCYALMRTAAL